MGSTPLLSVVIPAYQAESTIVGTLEGICVQLADVAGGVEVLVIDDGSTDRGAVKVKGLAKHYPALRLLKNSQNLGHGASRNRGIEESQGHYLIFVDADDRLLTGALEAIARQCEESQADVVFIGAQETKAGPPRVITDDAMLRALSEAGSGWSAREHPELLMWPPATWSKVYKRQFLIRENIRFPDGYHQDIPWSVDVTIRAESISAVPKVCYDYVRRGQGSSTTRSKGLSTLARVNQVSRVRETYSAANLPSNLMAYLVALMSVHLIWGNRAAYRTIPDERHEEYFHSCARELQLWWLLARPGREVKSEPLMPTAERIFFSSALLSDDWSLWQRALERHAWGLRWKRRFDWRRYRSRERS